MFASLRKCSGYWNFNHLDKYLLLLQLNSTWGHALLPPLLLLFVCLFVCLLACCSFFVIVFHGQAPTKRIDKEIKPDGQMPMVSWFEIFVLLQGKQFPDCYLLVHLRRNWAAEATHVLLSVDNFIKKGNRPQATCAHVINVYGLRIKRRSLQALQVGSHKSSESGLAIIFFEVL